MAANESPKHKWKRTSLTPALGVPYYAARSRTSSADANLTAAQEGLMELSDLLKLWNDKNELRRRVLLLDDDIGFRHSLREHVSPALSVEVDLASSVEEGLALWSTHKHAVILVDLVLSDEDTTASVEFVRKVGRGPHVVFITGYDLLSLGEPLQKLARNIDATFMQKPLDSIVDVIENLLHTWEDSKSVLSQSTH